LNPWAGHALILKMKNEYVRNIALDIILTILTCGIYNLFVQSAQINALNSMLQSQKYQFLHWLLFCLVTCGLYHIYHEYRMSEDIARLVGRDPGTDGLISVLLTSFGLHIVADAIQQTHINRFYGSTDL